MTSLYQIVEQYRSLERLDPSEDLPLDVIRDTLEGLTGELEVKATNVARYILNLEAMATAVENAAAAMKVRAERIRDRSESIREYLRTNMVAANITKIEAVEFTLAIKLNPPAVIIDDEKQLPAQFMVAPPAPPPPPAKPAKGLIADALKRGQMVPGAHLEQRVRMEIKV